MFYKDYIYIYYVYECYVCMYMCALYVFFMFVELEKDLEFFGFRVSL